MTTEEQKGLSEASCLIVELAEKLGVKSIKDLPGVWIHQIDEKWTVAANGHREIMSAGLKEGMMVDLAPYHFAVWRNGWLFALLTPFGGQFMGVNGKGEDEFCEMMIQKLKE